MGKKKKYEKITDITYVDQQGNVVNQKLTGKTGGYTRETTPALVGASQNNTVKGVEPTVKVAQTNFKNAENDLNLAQSRYETALANELKKTGKDYRTKFDDFTKNKISYQTKEQDKENATPKIEKIPIQEANKNLQPELNDVQEKFDKWKIANYENNLAKAQSKPVTLWDKTGGNVTRALVDMVSPLTQGEAYEMKDEKGNKTYLPSYNELRQQEVQNSYGDNLIGKAAKFSGDVLYGGTKIAGAAALDTVTGGLGGKALYWTDMATDNYKNVKNQGYSDKQALANTAIATGTEFLTEKLLGGFAGKLTGGEASAVENAVSKAVSKVVSNPQAAKVIGGMTSEGLEEFTQEYIGALNDKITLGKDTNLEDLVKDSLYSGLVGAGTAGLVEGGINSINVARPSFNQNNQPIRSQETPIQAPITQNNINTQEQVKTTPIRQENKQINTQQVQTRVEPQTVETKPVAKLTQQEQQELENNPKAKENTVNDYEEYQKKIKDKIREARETIGNDFADDLEKQRQEYNERHPLENKVYEATKSKPVDNDKINDSFFKKHTSDFDGKTGTKTQDGTITSMKLQKGDNLAKLTFTEGNDKIWIDELYIKNQNQGYGSEIVNALKEYAKKNGKNVDTFKELETAKGFWDKTIRNNQQQIPETQKLTQQEQQELDTLKNFPFELDEQQERRMDELLLKQNKDLEKNMSPVRDLSDVRDFNEVGSKKVNAYQYDNPEVKPYFQEVAKDMLDDISNSTKGERYMTPDGEMRGIKRNVPNDIAELLDGENGIKYSYKEIEDGLNAIIKDNGAENKAVAKRLEFYIDQRLRNGYRGYLGENIPSNLEYIETLRNKNAGEGKPINTQNITNQPVNNKQKQLEIINQNNQMQDEYHTGIRNENDIKTFDEAIQDDESFVWGDYSKEDAERDLQKGTVTVYSSKPIEQGAFVSTSQNQARDYAGGGKIYSQEVPINDVAWINGDEGQYAKVENPNIPAEMEKEEVSKELEGKNVITIKNDNLQNVSKDKIKGENTGVSIGDKEVQLQIPTDSKPNKLGQYIPKDGFTKTELKDGKIGDSKFYKNATERADFIRDEVRQKIQEDDYVKHYKKVTNEESMQEAFNDLNTRGTEAIADFFNNNKELTSKDTAMGWLLIEQSQENGDYDFANQVLRKMRENASKTGQTMQMYNYYARLTPEGMYKWAGDQLLRAEEIFEKGKTKKWIEQNKDRWQLNGKETEFIKNQMNRVQELNKMNDSDTTTIDIKGKEKKVTVDRAKQVEIAKIQAMIENKIPPKKGQALNAWMRISMLGNLKTIGTRNPLGNIALRPVNDVGDFVGSIADYALSKVTGYRTKGNFNPSAQVKGLVKGASETVQDARLGIDTKNAKGNRFEIGQGKSFNERHEGVAKVLNPFAKLGNKADSAVSFLLDLGDRPFYNATYEQSLQNQMKLNGIDNIDNVPDWMKNIAEKEGLERTYQDDNNYTSAVIDIRNAMNKFNVKGYGLGDVLIPFAKTPANLTKAIVDYSPAGFVSAITKGNELRTAINNGQFTPEMQHTFVNQLGKATAGTLLYVLGASLAKAGITTGGADDDKDVADFMRNTLGIQPYSIKIGDKTFTYDWAQPVASSLAIPADIKKGIKDAKEGEVDLEYIIHQAFSTSGAILLEQSFLQGIKDVLGGYGDPIDNLMSEIEGLPARAVPTFLQQLITYSDSTKRMSYGNKGIDNAISQAQAKTPWTKDLPVYRNSMGKEVKMYGGKNTFFNVFLNPANYSEGNASKSAKEIYKVYQATNDKSILPRLVDSNLKNEDGTKLTNQQKSDFLKISGDIIEKNVDDLRNNDEYNSMSDEDKAQAIKSIVDYAYNKARKDIAGHELSSAYKKAEKAEESGYAIADYYISKQANKTTKNTSTNNRNRYQELANKGIDGRTYDDFKAFVSTAKGESRTGGLTKKQKIINYIEELPLTAQEKQNLYDDYLENTGMFQYYK